MTNWKKPDRAPGRSVQENVDKLIRLLELLDPAKAKMYKRTQENLVFATAYRAADKDLPICSECGANCRPLPAALDFTAEFWSHCCYAPIEQDAGAEP